jgi:hypothetical protein
MPDLSRPDNSPRRFDLLLSTTQRGLARNGIWNDTAIAQLNDRELRTLANVGPIGRQDIRRHIPNPTGR